MEMVYSSEMLCSLLTIWYTLEGKCGNVTKEHFLRGFMWTVDKRRDQYFLPDQWLSKFHAEYFGNLTVSYQFAVFKNKNCL
jgi:hypothetical protein